MATQLAEVADTGATDTNDNAEPVARDYEAEARAHGWTPKEDFKGDPSRWVDAETFARRADEVMPFLKKQLEAVKRENADIKKQAARAAEYFSKAEERAYERAKAEITAKMEAAVEIGDVAAHRAAQKELDGLERETPKPAQVDQLSVKEALIEFRDENPWYDEGGVARDYADVVAEKYKDRAADMPPAEFFTFVAEKVKERYPQLGKVKAELRKGVSAVEAPTGRATARGRSFSDLPVEAQRMCDKWVKSGVIKDRAAYVSTYQWDDRK